MVVVCIYMFYCHSLLFQTFIRTAGRNKITVLHSFSFFHRFKLIRIARGFIRLYC